MKKNTTSKPAPRNASVVDLGAELAKRRLREDDIESAHLELERTRVLCRRVLAAGDALTVDSCMMLDELNAASGHARYYMEHCLGRNDQELMRERRS
jgi:hypothetical protein